MAGVDDQLVCEESQRELLRDEKAARSVVISNISAEIGKDEVMIYFQKTKIGGGEVDAVSMIEDGKAVVVFEKPEGLLAINQTSLPLLSCWHPYR